MPSDIAISVKNLKKIYSTNNQDKKTALDNVSLNINKGSIFGLLGPNGAGKSTFINILADLVKKTSGQIEVLGINYEKNLKEVKKLMGIVPQELNIDPFFTPNELLELQAGLYGIKKQERRTNEILNNVGLLEQKNSYARTLSGGMRRRLLVAKALVHSPEMLILDEPTAGVDVDLRRSLWNYIKKINKLGTTICLTTHYLEEAEELCDNITIINNGAVIMDDTKSNLLKSISIKTVLFQVNKIDKFPNELKAYNPIFNDGHLKITYDKNITSLKQIIDILNKHKIIYQEISTYESDLEDIFLKLVKSS